MALNRTKVLEAAQKYLQKGQHDKAIAEYEKLVKEDPRDVRTLLKIGDLHTRRHSIPEAIATYGQVAEQYARQGFFLKAVAVYKQILKLDPEQLDVCEKLASMYEELALVSDALKTYEAVAEGHMRAGRPSKALATMERMIALDPDNIAVRIKFAEALSRAEKPTEAAEAFAAGAALLKEQGRMDDYIRVAERQLYHQPANSGLAKELSSLYLERKDAKRALAKLQVCFKSDPRDIQTLEMLAEAFRQLGQGSKTISVLREIARIHQELGADEPRKRALSRILDLDPDDQEARQALGAAPRGRDRRFGRTIIDGRSPEERAEAAAAREVDSTEIEEVSVSDAELLVEEGEDDLLVIEDSRASKAPPEPKPKAQRAPETPEQRIDRLLGEADLQASSGFWLEVEGILEEVLELDPESTDARERLKDLYLQLGRTEEAVGQMLLLADAYAETDIDRAIGYMQHAIRVSPEDPRPKLRLQALDAEQSESEVAALELVHHHAPAEVDPLEAPITPDEFDSAPPPRPASHPPDELDAMLDVPIEDDFSAPPPMAPPAAAAMATAATVPDDDDDLVPEPPPREAPPSDPFAPRSRTMDSLPRVSQVDDMIDSAMRSGPPAVEIVSSSERPDDDGVPDPELPGTEEDLLRAPSSRPPGSARPGSFDSLLARPIEDDFGAPARAPSHAPPLSMLERPIEDDFATDAGRTSEPPVQLVARRSSRAPQEEAPKGPPASDAFDLADPRYDEGESGLVDLDAASQSDAYAEPGDTGGDLESDENPFPVTGEVTAASQVPASLLAQQAEERFGPGSVPQAEATDEAEEADLEADASERPSRPVPRSSAPAPAGDFDDIPDPVLPPEPAAAPAPVEAPAAAAADPAGSDANPEVDEAIDEAEFFFQQGMVDDAIEAVQEALLIYPDSPRLQAKLSEFEKAASEPPPAPEEEADADDESFRLAEQLAEQLGEMPEETHSESIDVEQVFEQFKKGVAEQVSADDSATHFDLGIAYKEMGLVDDAMSEFRIAAQDPSRECMSRTMIGLCLIGRGNAAGAVEEFRSALASPHKDERAELGLHYELGIALQQMGDLAAALTELEQVVERDPRFRDAQSRVETLRAQVPAAPAGGDERDELDRAFDDLMSDGD